MFMIKSTSSNRDYNKKVWYVVSSTINLITGSGRGQYTVFICSIDGLATVAYLIVYMRSTLPELIKLIIKWLQKHQLLL